MGKNKGGKKGGGQDFSYNAVDPNDYNNSMTGGGDDTFYGGGKANKGGCGGRGSKSHNFKESAKANIRRKEKEQRV